MPAALGMDNNPGTRIARKIEADDRRLRKARSVEAAWWDCLSFFGKLLPGLLSEAKLMGPIEISDFRPTNYGPGRFMVCIRGVSNDSRTGTYVVFFNNNAYSATACHFRRLRKAELSTTRLA
jgi:hypothetical protein